jgi:acetate kinase
VRVLVVNAGSSSLKLSLVDAGERVASGTQLAAIADFGHIDAVGHRIVHGGTRFRQATLISAEVEAALHALASLAPLHQAKSLNALAAVRSEVGDELPEVACFDTAFHAELPPAAATYALPREWRDRWPLRRFGFHGLAHASVVREATRRLGSVPGRMISCHLGAGASLAAIRDGRSIDTTMGFTPLEGLVMATRAGSVDPGLVLWLLQQTELTPDPVARALEHESGLAALAGTADMREIVRSRDRGEDAAALAFAVYVHHVLASIGAMAAALGGCDVLTFSGGVGENSDPVRDAVTAGLGFLAARPECLVIEAREDLEIAAAATALLEG